MRKVVLVALAVLGCAVWFNSGRLEVPLQQPEIAAAEEPKKNDVYIYITGAVRKPGLYSFSDDAVRVGDAVRAAGDAAPYADVSAVNYADTIYDGMHIHIPYNLDGEPAGNQGNQTNQGNLININEADAEQMDKLPGVGASMAKKIVEYRTEHGSFSAVEDLKKVKGIGAAKWEKLKDKVTV